MTTSSITQGTYEDWQTLAKIEAICFPPEEAASETSIKERLSLYPEGAFVATVNHEIVGFVNGGSTNTKVVEDSFYASMEDHKSSGKYLVVFGLNVLPDYRGNGYAKKLMKAFIDFGRQEKKTAVLLTCKKHMMEFYASLGFVNHGLSKSSHGGASWYEMQLTL